VLAALRLIPRLPSSATITGELGLGLGLG